MKVIKFIFVCLFAAAFLGACGADPADSNQGDEGGVFVRSVVAKVMFSEDFINSRSVPGITSSELCQTALKAVIIDVDNLSTSEVALAGSETGDDCEVKLPLEAEKPYSIGFIDKNGCYISTVSTERGNILKVPEGSGDINLGEITVSRRNAVYPLYIYCSVPEGQENTVIDPCAIYYSCSDFGLQDSGKNGLCLPLDELVEAGNCNDDSQ